MSWLRPGLSRHHTPLAMIGAKPGDRVLVCGATDAALIAELARITGLNGATIAVDPRPESRAFVEAAATAAGTLVEFESASPAALPFERETVDVVVLQVRLAELSSKDQRASVDEALRVLRIGGRVVLIERSSAPGLLGALRPRIRGLGGDALLALLERAGARGVRLLANTGGVLYAEGRASRGPVGFAT